MLEIKDLRVSVEGKEILKGINLKVNAGEVHAIMGPNGSGKTTLIKSILGMVFPNEGEIWFQGNLITGEHKYRSEIGYLPQIANFPENLKVEEQ